MLTEGESLAETRLPLKINLYVAIWTSTILAERLGGGGGYSLGTCNLEKKNDGQRFAGVVCYIDHILVRL